MNYQHIPDSSSRDISLNGQLIYTCKNLKLFVIFAVHDVKCMTDFMRH